MRSFSHLSKKTVTARRGVQPRKVISNLQIRNQMNNVRHHSSTPTSSSSKMLANRKISFGNRNQLRCFSSSRKLRSDDPPHIKKALSHLSPAIKRVTHLEIDSGKGSYLYTTDGRRILDFATAIAVSGLGHSHPKMVKNLQDQVAKLVHSGQNLALHTPLIELTQSITKIAPPGLDGLFLMNSGSEAVESAVKLARQATKKQNIVAFTGGFHGRTMGAMALTTSSTAYSVGFGPLMGGAYHSSFPYCHRCPCKPESGTMECCQVPEHYLDEFFQLHTHPSETAAVLIEPVLGEGGYVVPPTSFMRKLRDLCDQHQMLLIADEVQSGFGRTGHYFAINGHFGIVPDVVVFAKTAGSGFPISGILTRPDLLATQTMGSMGGTYGANPLGCTAMRTTIEIMEEENVLKNVQNRGAELRQQLAHVQAQHPQIISDIRGLGLMIGVELNDKAVPKGTAAKVSKKAAENGMFLLSTGIHETLRFIPPLTVSAEEIREGVQIFHKTLHDLKLL